MGWWTRYPLPVFLRSVFRSFQYLSKGKGCVTISKVWRNLVWQYYMTPLYLILECSILLNSHEYETSLSVRLCAQSPFDIHIVTSWLIWNGEKILWQTFTLSLYMYGCLYLCFLGICGILLLNILVFAFYHDQFIAKLCFFSIFPYLEELVEERGHPPSPISRI